MTNCIAAVLAGLAEVRADIAADEATARGEGFDGIANAYAIAGARLDGAMWGIEKTIRTCPTSPVDPCWHEECSLPAGHEGLHESYMAPRVTPPGATT